jgi:hypothetical protein
VPRARGGSELIGRRRRSTDAGNLLVPPRVSKAERRGRMPGIKTIVWPYERFQELHELLSVHDANGLNIIADDDHASILVVRDKVAAAAECGQRMAPLEVVPSLRNPKSVRNEATTCEACGREGGLAPMDDGGTAVSSGAQTPRGIDYDESPVIRHGRRPTGTADEIASSARTTVDDTERNDTVSPTAASGRGNPNRDLTLGEGIREYSAALVLETQDPNSNKRKERERKQKGKGGKKPPKPKGINGETRPDAAMEGEVSDTEAVWTEARKWLTDEIAGYPPDSDVRKTKGEDADKMVTNALAVANPEAIGNWYDIIHHWKVDSGLVAKAYRNLQRDGGSMVPREVLDGSQPASSAASVSASYTTGARGRKVRVAAFQEAYWAIDYSEIQGLLQPIMDLLQLGKLYRAYDAAVAEVSASADYGVNNSTRSEAKTWIFQSLFPTLASNGRRLAGAGPKWNVFDKRLVYGSKMAKLEEVLGPCLFVLLPRSVTKTFLGNTLSHTRLDLWIRMVQKFNLRFAGIALKTNELLSRGLLGASLPFEPYHKRLVIEGCKKSEAMQADPVELYRTMDPTALSDAGGQTGASTPVAQIELEQMQIGLKSFGMEGIMADGMMFDGTSQQWPGDTIFDSVILSDGYGVNSSFGLGDSPGVFV